MFGLIPPKPKRKTKRYGWKPQLPDFRDLKRPRGFAGTTYPLTVDLRANMPPVYNQGNLGSCADNAVGAAIASCLMMANYKWQFTPSRLFLYYNARALEGTVWTDSGSSLRDVIKVANAQGVCPEDSNPGWNWTYSDGPIKFRLKPPAICYKDAILHRALKYTAVSQDLQSFRESLANGVPFVFGITVYESFESDATTQTGVVTMPGPNEDILGGHALLAVGYDDVHGWVIFRNSWGPSWGDKGYGYIPYEYLLNQGLSSDFWAIELVGT